jgi:hypothetical protein
MIKNDRLNLQIVISDVSHDNNHTLISEKDIHDEVARSSRNLPVHMYVSLTVRQMKPRVAGEGQSLKHLGSTG